MLEAMGKIPRGINIILFIWMGFAVYCALRNKSFRQRKELLLFYAAIAFMFAWRILIKIITSRYASAMIIPFAVFSSFLLFDTFRKKHLLIRLAWAAFFICTGFIYLKMSFDSITRHDYSTVVAEVFDRYKFSPNNYSFLVNNVQHNRLSYLSRIEGMKWASKKNTLKNQLHTSTSDVVLNYQVKKGEDELRGEKNLRTVASLPQKGSSKRQLVAIYTSMNKARPVSETKKPPYTPNLLKNGDLETLLSPEESHDVLNRHVKGYSSFYDGGEKIQLPAGTLFHSDADPLSRPELRSTGDVVIDGGHSIRVKLSDGDVYYFFLQKFTNGAYRYSMLVRGETGTQVSAVCRTDKGEGGDIVELSAFTIPDKRLFELTSDFVVDDLKDEESFLVGLRFHGGEAYFDNFSITRTEP